MTSATAVARRPHNPSLLATAAAAASVFLVVLMLLAVQLRAGRDPALGTSGPVPAARVAKHAAAKKGHPTPTLVTSASGH
jgi:hypothetical protein